tara:strand:- start:205 stop:465 length:261 start_codon:yes stop_codon:yes gene_type:complete
MDKNHVFRTGKYAGKTVNYVYQNDKRYFSWILENRPEMLKSHKKKVESRTYDKPYKKPVYIDPPDVSDEDMGKIKPATISEAFDLD